MNALWIFGVLIMSFLTVRAQEIPLLDGRNPGQGVSLADVAGRVGPGQILVFGEHHGFKTAQRAQLQMLDALRNRGLRVSVGLEFFSYPFQGLVDSYRAGALNEVDFLKQIQWGGLSYDFYRDQAVFPRLAFQEQTLAINAPRSLTSKIAKSGLDSLTAEEKALLPPEFALGRASYKKRFLEMMPHLPSPEAGERYFAAQSVWDDTMAWKAVEFIKAHPDQVLVLVVGDGHVQYGGGLPDRLEARSRQKPLVFSYVNRAGLSDLELQEELKVSPLEGPRGDFIWLASELTSSNPQF